MIRKSGVPSSSGLNSWCLLSLCLSVCPVKTKAFWTAETSVITHPTTQRQSTAAPLWEPQTRIVLHSVWLCVKQTAADLSVVTQWQGPNVGLTMLNVCYKHESYSFTFIHIWYQHNKNEINVHVSKYPTLHAVLFSLLVSLCVAGGAVRLFDKIVWITPVLLNRALRSLTIVR
jgi:hypothetical protein